MWLGLAAPVSNVRCLIISLGMSLAAVQSAACSKDLTACRWVGLVRGWMGRHSSLASSLKSPMQHT